MRNDIPVTIIGNLTADPELRFTPSSVAVVRFTVASTPRTFDRQTNEWKDSEPTFMDCTAWRDQAEHAAESLVKGARVIVAGTIITERWEDKETGDKRSAIRLRVDEIGASLTYATVKISKVSRTRGGLEMTDPETGETANLRERPAEPAAATS